MNRWFQDLPIRRKLRLLIVATGSIALVLASVTLLILKSMDLRKETLTEISTLTEVIGATTTAALTFQDRSAAEETLSALRADKTYRRGRGLRQRWFPVRTLSATWSDCGRRRTPFSRSLPRRRHTAA